MFSFLEGKIEYTDSKSVIINSGGAGYKVSVAPKLVQELSKSGDESVKLYIHSQMNMREGTFDMYGFDVKEDLELFTLIRGVNGIGPKSAMNILSTVEPKYLKAAVVNDDDSYLKKVSGLGPKTAKRLILELKNKVDYIDFGDGEGINLTHESQAIEALLALGYSNAQAQTVLKEIKADTLEDLVRQALNMLSKK